MPSDNLAPESIPGSLEQRSGVEPQRSEENTEPLGTSKTEDLTQQSASPLHLRLPLVDESFGEAARQRQGELTKPPGSLGRLEALAEKLAIWQSSAIPRVRPAATLLFAADHPVTVHGICPYPKEVTRAMLENFAGGGAAASVLSHHQRIPLTVVDVGVHVGCTVSGRTASATIERDPVCDCDAGDILVEDAMSPETFMAAVVAGRAAVQRQSPQLRCLILGEMGIGNTTAAAAVCAALLDGDPADMVGVGTGSQGELLARKKQVVRDSVARATDGQAGRLSPTEALRRLGGREIAALYGAMLESVERRILILVDGFIVTAAALVLLREHPRAVAGMVFAHRSDERAHGRVLEHLGVAPLLELGMRLGEGSGALMAFPIVEQACVLHEKMATFQSAQVPNRADAEP